MSFFVFLLVSAVFMPAFALNSDGVSLLSFKYSTLSDPLSALENWNYDDETPCSWNGVTCKKLGVNGTQEDIFRVTSLILSEKQLLGSIPPDLGFIEHLTHLDLSNNFLNGSLPGSLFNLTELQVMSLSGNEISGELPESVAGMRSLQLLNLSDNALAGRLPEGLSNLKNLSVVSLRGNYFSGFVPNGFNSVQILDLSSNLLNGSLPIEFGGENLRFLNLSRNNLSGSIPGKFGGKIPSNSTIDLSFNNFTGAIPRTPCLHNQKVESFRGNVHLCGKPLKNLCSIPSNLSIPPNISTTSPAIAVIPKPLESTPIANSSATPTAKKKTQNGLKPTTIVAIAVADFAGIAIIALAILYVFQLKKKKAIDQHSNGSIIQNPPKIEQKLTQSETAISKIEQQEDPKKPNICPCLPIKAGEITSEEATSTDSDGISNGTSDGLQMKNEGLNYQHRGGGKLVILDGETELDMETLLKASAFILGAAGATIVYKAVISDGTAFAVRRIGEIGIGRFRDFESKLRVIAKLRHPNLVRTRGFYWGEDEKLVIYDYISNGSLSSFSYGKSSSSSLQLPLEVRLKIARGIARGLAFLHEKKHTHGNIKPNNILLNHDFEPVISDFGLDWLVFGNNNKASSSNRNIESQRSNTILFDHPNNTTSPHPNPSLSTSGMSPYQAPESLYSLKPNPKWDVYSFGVVLIELLTGRVFSERELIHWSAAAGSTSEDDKNRILRFADVAIRGDAEGREEATLGCLKLGFGCASFVPQKRPSMKEAIQVLDKILC